ncbi:MAG: glycosyltransferase family 39 protein [Bdellovibrionota bacterium]
MNQIKSLMSDFKSREIPFFSPLGIILFLGSVLYLQHVYVPGFFHDGYLYAALGKNAVFRGHWLVPFMSETVYPKFSEHPPLFFMIEGLFFSLVGSSFTAARLFAGLWGLVLLGSMFKFARRFYSENFAFIATFLLATMPFLIKKVRFPNLDLPLSICFILCFYYFMRITETKKLKHYLKFSILLGLAFLIKGIPALFILLAIFLFVLVEKNLRTFLLDGKAWGAILFSLMIFALWPLALWMSGEFLIFQEWIDRQFFATIVNARGQKEFEFFSYFTHLLKYSGPWFVLGCLGITKRPWSHATKLCIVAFGSMLLCLSLMKWKYSHYLLPAYPALCILASTFIYPFVKDRMILCKNFAFLLALAGAVTFAIFPLGVQSNRDQGLVEMTRQLPRLNQSKDFILVDDAYEFWAWANYLSFVYDANPRVMLMAEVKKSLEQFSDSIYFMKKSNFDQIKDALPPKIMQLFYMEKNDVVVLGPDHLAFP